jgi:hypothetical protein
MFRVDQSDLIFDILGESFCLWDVFFTEKYVKNYRNSIFIRIIRSTMEMDVEKLKCVIRVYREI